MEVRLAKKSEAVCLCADRDGDDGDGGAAEGSNLPCRGRSDGDSRDAVWDMQFSKSIRIIWDIGRDQKYFECRCGCK